MKDNTDPTVLIALITALTAIIAPMITAIINNRSALKIKELETEENRFNSVILHEREVLENALSGIGILMSWKDADSIKEACKNILMAAVYVDTKTAAKLQLLVSNVMEPEDNTDIFDYAEICEAIKAEIGKRTDHNIRKVGVVSQ